MDSYETNKDTYAIMSVNDDVSKVLEKDEEYYINKNSYEVMEDSCSYYGSSCEGRIKGTKQILGSNYKVPIVVEETNEIIFFPTEAATNANCIWLSLNNINGFTKVILIQEKS